MTVIYSRFATTLGGPCWPNNRMQAFDPPFWNFWDIVLISARPTRLLLPQVWVSGRPRLPASALALLLRRLRLPPPSLGGRRLLRSEQKLLLALQQRGDFTSQTCDGGLLSSRQVCLARCNTGATLVGVFSSSLHIVASYCSPVLSQDAHWQEDLLCVWACPG